MQNAPLRLVFETPLGTMVRTVQSASPLRDELKRGAAAEQATQDAAAKWGLPDFVFGATALRDGPASREIGDGLLLVGNIGIVVQVKCRDAPSEDLERETAWITKQAARALRQGNGTIRRLLRGPLMLSNGRGRDVQVDGRAYDWIVVAVIDHPGVAVRLSPSVDDSSNPAVVLIRRDWEFLFQQLKSTHAVARYFRRVAGEPWELGMEAVRYHQLANADHLVGPQPISKRLLGAGANPRRFTSPVLPIEPVAGTESIEHVLVRTIFEDIATSPLGNRPELDRLQLLAELDRFPVGLRENIGRYLLDALGALSDVQTPDVGWQLRRMLGPADGETMAHLCFGACSSPCSEMILNAFAGWVELRHHDAGIAVGEDEAAVSTVGVLLTPHRQTQRPWDTTVVSVTGKLEIDPGDLARYRELWDARGSAELPPGDCIGFS